MAKTILCAALALVLTACGGGGGSDGPTAGGVSVPSCTPRVVTVALLGDSTQWGYDSATHVQAVHRPGIELQAEMDAEFGPGAVVVTDYAVSGTMANQAPRVSADVIVANYGINDTGHRTVAQYTADMRAIGATLIETQSPIHDDIQPLTEQAKFVAAAEGLGLPVADVNAAVLAIPGWQSSMVDGVHPVDALYLTIVDTVLAPAVSKQVAPLRCF